MKKLLVFLILFISFGIIKADKWDDLKLQFPDKGMEINLLSLAVDVGLAEDADEENKKFSQDVINLLNNIQGNRLKINRLLNECNKMINQIRKIKK